jgi:hypothetical protein
MQNYSSVFADTLALYESLYVPGDQGDAAKGQVTVRAGLTINQTIDPRVGYIAKSGGQTQFHGVAVDALLDSVDGSGADYLTDELQPDGRRLIKLAYSVYATPPPGTPITNWVQPTAAYLEYPGPLVLKGAAPGPEPEPVPETDVLAELADIKATLALMQEQQASDTDALLLKSDENTTAILNAIADFRGYVVDVIEDVEEFVNKLGKGILFIRRHRPDEP